MKIKMKRIFGLLLSLTLVVGLFPGMSLTVYAAAESVDVDYSCKDGGSASENPDGTFVAVPNPGWQFDHWVYYWGEGAGSGSSTDNPLELPNYYYLEVVAYFVLASHTHSFTYSAGGATITATCGADGCTLPVVEGKPTATLTIAASGGTYDGTTAYGATITDTYSIQGGAKVQYQKKSGGSYGTTTETAPTDAGDYKASITVGGATASVEYTIAKANPTANAPTGLTATYGQTLANVSLEGKNPEGNTPGTWTWADSTKSVGNIVSPAATFKANFTPTSSNYKTVENVDVTVTVGKANAVAATVTANNRTYDGTEKPLVTVTGEATGGEMQYALGTATEATQPYTTSIPTANNAGTYYVWYKVVADNNHSDTAPVCVTVTIAKDNSSANIPEIGTIKYSGEPQELVTAGTVENGKMMYALGSDDKTAPEKEEFSTSIPTGTSVGTYYVWYYAKGNDGYEDSTPVCVIVTIIELKADTDIDENLLPRDKNTSVDTNGEIPVPDGLKNEAQLLADTTGEKVELKLVVAPKGEEKVTESETLQTDAQMSNNIKNQYKDENSVSVEVLEIDIEKYINDTKSDNLKETSKVLEIAIPYNWDGKYDPVVVRRHNDNVQVFTSLSEKATGEPKDGTFFADRDNHILYIYANLFSTYVVAYSSVEGNAQTIVASGGSSSSQQDYPKTVPVYRLYNKYKGAHLFTTNNEERDILLGEKAAEGWTDEGIAFETAVNSGTPVYRVFDLKNGIHYYTSDATVRDTYVANGCRDEGIAWYAAIKTGRTVYKVSNPANGRLLYTISKAEADALANAGFTCQEAEFVVY